MSLSTAIPSLSPAIEQFAQACTVQQAAIVHPALSRDAHEALADPDGLRRYERLHAALVLALELEAQAPASATTAAQDVTAIRAIIQEHRRLMRLVEDHPAQWDDLHRLFAEHIAPVRQG